MQPYSQQVIFKQFSGARFDNWIWTRGEVMEEIADLGLRDEDKDIELSSQYAHTVFCQLTPNNGGALLVPLFSCGWSKTTTSAWCDRCLADLSSYRHVHAVSVPLKQLHNCQMNGHDFMLPRMNPIGSGSFQLNYALEPA